MEARRVSESKVTMTEMVLPTHTNSLNSVFGGVIMSWIDICAAIAAQRHSQSPVVTASIDQLDFRAPVYIGWIVNLTASVNFVANTSMEVGVRIDAENPIKGEKFHTASAYLTFVALNGEGNPKKIAGLLAETEAEKRRMAAGEKRRQLRMDNRKTMKRYK